MLFLQIYLGTIGVLAVWMVINRLTRPKHGLANKDSIVVAQLTLYVMFLPVINLLWLIMLVASYVIWHIEKIKL